MFRLFAAIFFKRDLPSLSLQANPFKKGFPLQSGLGFNL